MAPHLRCIVPRFPKAEKGNEHRDHIEDLAHNAPDGAVIYVVCDPNGRDQEKLSDADLFSVPRPHSKRSATLRCEEKKRDPPLLAEKQEGRKARRGKASLRYPIINRFLAFVCKRKNHTAHNAEHIQKHSRPRAKKRELHGKRDRAPRLKKEIAFVFLALVG
jgi:hypothetical protein